MSSETMMQRSVVTIAVVIALAAAVLTLHGWSLTLHQLVDLLHQLPRPVQTLLGGTRLAHLLDASR